MITIKLISDTKNNSYFGWQITYLLFYFHSNILILNTVPIFHFLEINNERFKCFDLIHQPEKYEI
ncbi:hypothetical protein BH10BAC5_BH10BAC5_14940 [soil metagenome]